MFLTHASTELCTFIHQMFTLIFVIVFTTLVDFCDETRYRISWLFSYPGSQVVLKLKTSCFNTSMYFLSLSYLQLITFSMKCGHEVYKGSLLSLLEKTKTPANPLCTSTPGSMVNCTVSAFTTRMLFLAKECQ